MNARYGRSFGDEPRPLYRARILQLEENGVRVAFDDDNIESRLVYLEDIEQRVQVLGNHATLPIILLFSVVALGALKSILKIFLCVVTLSEES